MFHLTFIRHGCITPNFSQWLKKINLGVHRHHIYVWIMMDNVVLKQIDNGSDISNCSDFIIYGGRIFFQDSLDLAGYQSLYIYHWTRIHFRGGNHCLGVGNYTHFLHVHTAWVVPCILGVLLGSYHCWAVLQRITNLLLCSDMRFLVFPWSCLI